MSRLHRRVTINRAISRMKEAPGATYIGKRSRAERNSEKIDGTPRRQQWSERLGRSGGLPLACQRFLCAHLLSLRRQRRLCRAALRPLCPRSGFGRCRVAGFLRRLEGGPRGNREKHRRSGLETARRANRRARRTCRRLRRRLGCGRDGRWREDQGRAAGRPFGCGIARRRRGIPCAPS